MLKRDDYIRSKNEAVFSKWQGFTRFMLPRKPFPETAELRKTLADLGSKVLTGANGYRVQGSFPGLYEAVIGHDQGSLADQDTESIRSRLQPYDRPSVHHDFPGLSKTILPFTQRKIGIRTEEKMRMFEEETEINCDAAEEKSKFAASIHRLSRSRPQSVSDRHDDIVSSDSVCGVLLEDGTTCTTIPVNGRKRCTDHKGQRISQKHLLHTERECKETEDICGVILPSMEPCRVKPVSRRKRCEDHKGMRVNAFFFLLNPTQGSKTVKEDKSKPKTSTRSVNQEDSSPGLLCEATTKNGLPCTRSVAMGSRTCWQHKEKTLDKRPSENVQPMTVNQVICGIKLHNGPVCEKSPAKGRKRCEEHKGMRMTS